jgi:hypothetical protein
VADYVSANPPYGSRSLAKTARKRAKKSRQQEEKSETTAIAILCWPAIADAGMMQASG